MFGQASSQRFITGELSVWENGNKETKMKTEKLRDGSIIGGDKEGKIEQKT